jgi:Coenzyme PQQ synthesis protein D (PqqD)
MLNPGCIVQRDPSVIAAAVGEDVVMVSITNGFYYGVSDVAREIWNALETPQKISTLINELAINYNIDQPTCEEHTLSFLEELLAEGLLQVTNEPSE